MIRIAVCDDSPAFLQQTKFMIDHWDNKPSQLSVELFEDGDSLVQAHTRKPFDIILLDIIMPLLDGIEAARELRTIDKTVPIVFLTSSPDFAITSYSVKASNYLLKPVNPPLLFSCLEELVSEIKSSELGISVKGIHAIHRLRLSDIEYVESQGKHIIFSLIDGRTVESLDPLYTFENVLQPSHGFFKCHRSYIINLYSIDRYSQKEIIMHSGCRVPISRSCQKSFESVYFETMFRKAGDR